MSNQNSNYLYTNPPADEGANSNSAQIGTSSYSTLAGGVAFKNN